MRAWVVLQVEGRLREASLCILHTGPLIVALLLPTRFEAIHLVQAVSEVPGLILSVG